jgi:hypothetical protein
MPAIAQAGQTFKRTEHRRAKGATLLSARGADDEEPKEKSLAEALDEI